MNDLTSLLDFVKVVSNVLILPLLGMIYSIQGRMSRMEGQLSLLVNNHSTKGRG